MKNKYSVEIIQVTVCPNNDKLKNPIRNLKFNKFNRTHKALSYDFSYDRPLDNNVGGSISIAKWGDGGWREIPFVGYQTNMCESMMNFFKDCWVEFHRRVGVEHPDKCPIPSVLTYLFRITLTKIVFLGKLLA